MFAVNSVVDNYVASVVALSSPRYKVGDTVTMKLMVREKASQLFSLPVCVVRFIGSVHQCSYIHWFYWMPVVCKVS